MNQVVPAARPASSGRAQSIAGLDIADLLLAVRWGGGVDAAERAKIGPESPYPPPRSLVLGPTALSLRMQWAFELPRPPGVPKSCGHAARHVLRPSTTALALRARWRPPHSPFLCTFS